LEDTVSLIYEHLESLLKIYQRQRIQSPTRALIHRLAEVGYLYKRVDSFIRTREGQAGVGMIEQSLCHHLQTQLTEYYRLIAVLESQMSLSSTTPADGQTGDGMSLQAQESGLTLRRLDVWINDWRLRLRMMSVCVEGAKGKQHHFTFVIPG
jgi:gamma-tubulin complex component 3